MPLNTQQVLSRLVRLQGPEQEQQIAFAPASPIVLPASLKTDKMIWGLLVQFHGRVAVGATTFAPVYEALSNLIQEFKVYGTHRRYGAQTPFQLRGNTVFDLAAQFGRGGYTPTIGVNGVKGGSFAGTGSTNYDVDVFWLIPFPPQGIPLTDQAYYGMIKGPEWAGDLHLQMSTGDGTSLGTTAGNITFSSYGSGSGAAQLFVSTIRAVMSVQLMNAISPAICFKTYKNLDATVQGASLVGTKVSDLNIGKGTTRVVLKSGTLQTGVTSGVEVFASVSDSILTRAFPALDGKQLRNPYNNLSSQEYEGYAIAKSVLKGYNVLDFIEGGVILGMFPSQGLTSARRFEVDSDITGAANQGCEVIQEEILGTPVHNPA